MSVDAIVVLSVLAAAFVAFVSGKVRPDLVAVAGLVALLLSGVIEPEAAFAGFSSFAVITIAGLMVIGVGLERSGVVTWVARQLERVIKESTTRLLVFNTLIPGLMSGFINIVATATFFISVILRLSKRLRRHASDLLMPMGAAALVGANLTLIGASHNLVVHSLLRDETGAGFSFFEFTPVGLAVLAAALGYIFLFGRKLMPHHAGPPAAEHKQVVPDLSALYQLHDLLFEIYVSEPGHSQMTTSEVASDRDGLTLIALVRDDELLFPEPDTQLMHGDLILVQGRQEKVEGLCARDERLVFMGAPEAQTSDPMNPTELVEVVVPPRSPAVGKTTDELGVREEFGILPIACFRDGEPFRLIARDATLKEGDGVLFYGPRQRTREFDPEKELLIYVKPDAPEMSSHARRLTPLAAAILLGVILAAALGVLPIAVSALAGAVLMSMLGIVDLGKLYGQIDWRTLILIAAMYPLGVALNDSGAAEVLGDGLVGLLGPLGPLAVMGGVALLTFVLTQPIHNAVVAIVMTPVAIQAASEVGADPRAFCVAVVVACSATFLMPYGHPAALMIQEPGAYRPVDYLRFGAGLSLVVMGVILGVVPVFFPL